MKSFRQRIAPAAAAMLIAVGARAEAPEPATADVPAVTELRQGLETESPELVARLDRPLSLEDCIQLALQRNILLEVGREARDAAQLQIGIAQGEYLPELQVVANAARVEDPTGIERRKDAEAKIVQRLPVGTALEAGVRVEDTNGDATPSTGIPTVAVVQPLLRDGGWMRGTSAIRDASLGAAAAETGLRSEVLRVVFQVKNAYFEILRRQKLIEVNERAVARDQELLEFSKAKLSAQLATQRDVLSADIILAQDRGRLVNAEAQYQSALDGMSSILGLRIGRSFQLEAEDLEIAPTSIDGDVAVAKAMHDNPTVQRVRLELERSELARRVAGNARLPQVDLRVAYSQRRGPLSASPTQKAWEGGVVMSYPFLNKTLGGTYRQAGLEYEQQRRLVLETERLVTLNVRDAVRNLQRSQDRISILKKNIEGAKAKVEYARVNFQLGRASNLDITDAQKDLLDAETDFVNELVTYRTGLAELEQLLGGSL